MHFPNSLSQKTGFLVILSLICFSYGYLISLNDLVFNNIATVVFILLSMATLCVGIKISEDLEKSKSTLRFLLLTTFIVNFFMILGTAAAQPAEKILWVADSYDMHIPGSVRIMELIQGKLTGPIVRTSIYDRTYIAHIFGAIFFAIFGVNQIASSLSLLIPKVICAYFIFKGTKKFLSFDHAKMAVLLYALLPTGIFYTITFYKEATLQMLVAMILYYVIKLYKKFKIKYFAILLLLFLFLGNERHYLVPCFAIAALIYVFSSKELKISYKIGMIVTCIIGYKIFTAYYWDISLSNVIKTLVIFKAKYSDYPDVAAANKNFPYPLGVIKLLLTPFITTVKLKTYTHYATLITWGSMIHHLLVVCFGFGFYKIYKEINNRKLLIILTAPFLTFLLAFGYVAPYNGRLRDSFLPLMVMVGSYTIVFILKKIKDRARGSY